MASNINKQEGLVLEVIEEYLSKNRFFNINNIVPFINSRLTKKSLNLNNEGIRLILKSLTNKNYIAEGSKLTKSQLLQNQNRKDIYYFIIENPGIHFNRIVNELNLTPPVVVWHINTLIKFGCIKKKKIGSHEAFFHISIDNKIARIMHLLSRDKCRVIIDYFLTYDKGVSKLELSKNIELSRNTVKKYIEKMEEIKILQRVKVSNKDLFFLNYKYYNRLISKLKIND